MNGLIGVIIQSRVTCAIVMKLSNWFSQFLLLITIAVPSLRRNVTQTHTYPPISLSPDVVF